MFRLVFALLLTASAIAHGQDANNDPSFGDAGWALTGWDPPGGVATDQLSAMTVQADGRIVLAGHVIAIPAGGQGGVMGCGITRLHADGSLDTSFGDGGHVLLNFPSLAPPGSSTPVNTCQPESLVIDGAGRIVMAARQRIFWFDGSGQVQNVPIHVGIARLLANGTPDTSFSFDGRMHFSYAEEDREGIAPKSLTVLAMPDGKLFLVMTVTPEREALGFFDGERVGSARLNANGTLDTSYFSNGKRVVSNGLIGAPAWGAHHAVLDDQGRILITGHLTGNHNAPSSMWVGRLLANGNLDASFGGGTSWWQSVAGVGSPPQAIAYALTLDHQNRVLMAGITLVGKTELNMIIARLSADGIPDAGFGTNGRVALPFQYQLQSVGTQAEAILVDDEDRIVVAGTAGRTLPNDQFENLFATARLLADGSIDATYWSGGRRIIDSSFQPTGSRRDLLARAGLARGANGRLLLAGRVRVGTVGTQPDEDFAVLALAGNAATDLIFADGFEALP